jgi:hypothetical protein
MSHTTRLLLTMEHASQTLPMFLSFQRTLDCIQQDAMLLSYISVAMLAVEIDIRLSNSRLFKHSIPIKAYKLSWAACD